MCITALPLHLNSRDEIEANFKDDNALGGTWRRFKKWIKPHLAYGPRDIHWYHRWRKIPLVLFAWFGAGESRWEESSGAFAIRALNSPIFFYTPSIFYLSRIQYWCDWSIQLQWPLFFGFHYKFRKKTFFGYIGAKRDGDLVYWFPAVFLGLDWK